MRPLVSIVIPTYNRKDDAVKLIDSIYAQDYKNFELILVDNASSDGTYETIMKKYSKKAKIIRNEINTGVCGGRNTGIKNSKGDYIIVIDHDTIVDKKMISELVNFLEANPKAGVVGPVVYYANEKDRIWCAGSIVNMKTGRVKFFGDNEKDIGQFKEPFEVQEIPSAFMFRRNIIDKGVKFDEFIFATYEDSDFCMNAMKLGYKVYCIPSAKLWHNVHKPSGVDAKLQNIGLVTPNRTFYVSRNKIVFMTKHADRLNLFVFILIFVPLYAVYYNLMIIKGKRWDILKYYWLGVLAGIGFFLRNFYRSQKEIY